MLSRESLEASWGLHQFTPGCRDLQIFRTALQGCECPVLSKTRPAEPPPSRRGRQRGNGNWQFQGVPKTHGFGTLQITLNIGLDSTIYAPFRAYRNIFSAYRNAKESGTLANMDPGKRVFIHGSTCRSPCPIWKPEVDRIQADSSHACLARYGSTS
jgi:hypothetical protein